MRIGVLLPLSLGPDGSRKPGGTQQRGPLELLGQSWDVSQLKCCCWFPDGVCGFPATSPSPTSLDQAIQGEKVGRHQGTGAYYGPWSEGACSLLARATQGVLNLDESVPVSGLSARHNLGYARLASGSLQAALPPELAS